MQIDKNVWNGMSPNKKGSIAELLACNWLMLNGYDVYKNLSAWGATDIIALKGHEITLIDVAFCSSGLDAKSACVRQRKTEGKNIKFLYVMPDGSCKWRDDVFPLRKSICPCCGKEYEVKEKSSRNKCLNCSRLGRKPPI